MITLIDGFRIQQNQTSVSSYAGNGEKYGFNISRLEGDGFKPFLRSKPIYSSAEQAVSEGDKVRDRVKSIDLTVNSKVLDEFELI